MTATDRRLGVNGNAAFKLPCRVATTANITLSGLQSIDGVTVVAGDRVLVKNQTNGTESGIYVADTSSWQRAVDFDGSRDCVQGTLVLVVSGSVSAATVYQLTTAAPVIGTSSLTFAVTGTPALAYASAFAQTLLDDTTAAAARTTLGAVGLTGNETVGGDKTFTGSNTVSGTMDGTTGRIKVPTRTAGDNGTDAASTAFVVAALTGTSVRQAVAAGPVSTAGLPTFLPSTNAALSITTQNVGSSAPLVAAAANGWSTTTGRSVDTLGYSTANLTWSGLTASRAAATPNFLYGTISGGVITPASTIVAPVHQWGGTPATTSGLITFNISEMKAYLGNGSTAPQTNLVLFGEAATDGTGVISTVAYAYNGKYDSGYVDTLPTSSQVVKNHNLGVTPMRHDFRIQCTTADQGYAVGDELGVANFTANDTTPLQRNPPVSVSLKTITLGPVGSYSGINKTTGAGVTFTAASWKYRMIADRGW